jgi:hypothetical protein
MFFLSLSSTLCLLANNIFYFSCFFALFSSQKGGTRLGVIMGLGMWALEPEKASTGWIGWKEGNREKEMRHFLIKSKKKRQGNDKKDHGIEEKLGKRRIPPPPSLFVCTITVSLFRVF